MENIFKGLGIALVTPFTADGAVDYRCLERLVQWQIDNGAAFLCILCTTSETPCLTRDEKGMVQKVITAVNRGRVPVLMGCGGNNTRAVIEELNSTDMIGVDGILSVCPYYNKPTQEGLYQHFSAIARSTSLPIVLYNVPSRTGVNMLASTVMRLASDCSNIVAVKEACGNFEQVKELLQNKPEGFDVLSGDDAMTYEMLVNGAVGAISVVANAYPKQVGQMIKKVQQGDYLAAKEIDTSLSELYHLLFKDGNPGGVKALMADMGLVENVLRLPLVPVSEAVREAIITCRRLIEQ